MQLVIAEKPSVARDLARVLGVRGGGGRNALEGTGRVITWCIGHLVELEEPPAYDPRWKAWRLDTLPMIPAAFKLRAVAGTRDQLRVVGDLLRDRRFTEVVNGCDAGREGELIFRYVYELARSRLPVRRLWISSLTDDAIRQGFSALRPGRDYDALADAARCRSEADWLVGMNATRAVTIRFRANDGGGPAARAPAGKRGRSPLPAVYSIGRVQTPTLAIIVRREQAIVSFRPRDYWEVRGTFAPTNDDGDSFPALWTLRRGGDAGAATRFGVRAHAEAIVARAAAGAEAPGSAAGAGGPVVEKLVQKRSREPPPLLFDLTSLQRTANRRYGMSAQRTLESAQALYERHKVLTYPRTDSRHLPADLAGELPKLFAGLAKLAEYAPFVAPLLGEHGGDDIDQARWVKTRRIFDGAKVHDHHAIIPTGKIPGVDALHRDEQRIFDLVARRFVGAFHPDAEFALTEAVIRVGPAEHAPGEPPAGLAVSGGPARTASRQRQPPDGEAHEQPLLAELPPPPDRFVARGRVRLVAGWQTVAGIDEPRSATREPSEIEPPTLPTLAEGQRLRGRFEALARQTRPPPRHTEATLLGAMESAGREIDDETLRAAMKDTGLGTPATRAATIETLVKRGFISREGKQVVATPTGIALIERLPVPTLASPELTGSWEARLVRIARGQDTRAAFMTDIVRYVREVTDAIRGGGPGGPGAAARPADSPPPARATTRSPGPAPRKTSLGVGAAPAPSAAGGAAALAPPLPCPRCRSGSLITGHRGWGCSRWRDGCAFVVWFQTAGKRVTETQLRALIQRGQTRKGKWSPSGATAVAGRLVLDLAATREAGAARFTAG